MYVRSVGMDFFFVITRIIIIVLRAGNKGTPNDRDGLGKHNIVYELARQVERS